MVPIYTIIINQKKDLEQVYFGLKDKMKNKKIIILQHGGGELANQLWNFASIYTYCLEKDFCCQNYSFFEYGQYFDIPLENKIINFLFFKPFQNHHERRYNPKNKFWRFVYKIYTKIITLIYKKRVISSVNPTNEKIYLSPTQENSLLNKLEKNSEPIYFTGWLFRNPDGIKKYKKEIVDFFKPKEQYTKPAEIKIKELRNKYKNIIGVHLRQSDYKEFKNGEYLISQQRVREILDEYLEKTNKNPQETIFVFASDGPIEKDTFLGINIEINKGNPIEDLYLLSLCDAVIGSDSSFGDFASLYGNKPHIILQKGKMDWDYYMGRNTYFSNKYSVMLDSVDYFSSTK